MMVAVRRVFVRPSPLKASPSLCVVVGVCISLVGPDVVALESGWLVADCQGARDFGLLVGRRVGIVVVAIVFVVGQRDDALTLVGVPANKRLGVVMAVVLRGALAGASASEVEVRHDGMPDQAVCVAVTSADGNSSTEVEGWAEDVAVSVYADVSQNL